MLCAYGAQEEDPLAPRVAATTTQTVGSKGHDGFTVALVL